MDVDILKDLARHQQWADAEHWKTIRANGALLEDAELRTRLNHMLNAQKMLMTLASGGQPDPAAMKEVTESMDQLEAAIVKTNAAFVEALDSADLDRKLALPRGPKGPFEAPAGVILLQALTHSQHHRGQNASRMRELGVKPPMTDYVFWFALGMP